MAETLALGYTYESTQRELSNEYHHGRVWMVFKNLSILVIWTKVNSVLKGLRQENDNCEGHLLTNYHISPFCQRQVHKFKSGTFYCMGISKCKAIARMKRLKQ